MERDDSAAKALADIAAGKPASLKGRFLSEDKSHRYQQLADLLAVLDAKYATPRLNIDAWINRIDSARQLTPESKVHDLQWHNSPEIAVGTFEFHMGPRR
ncbi:hypothetical protein [Dongia sp. agr-C8]